MEAFSNSVLGMLTLDDTDLARKGVSTEDILVLKILVKL
jgi:hypothetical protein